MGLKGICSGPEMGLSLSNLFVHANLVYWDEIVDYLFSIAGISKFKERVSVGLTKCDEMI